MKTRSSGEDPTSPTSEPEPADMADIEAMTAEQLAALRLELIAERERLSGRAWTTYEDEGKDNKEEQETHIYKEPLSYDEWCIQQDELEREEERLIKEKEAYIYKEPLSYDEWCKQQDELEREEERLTEATLTDYPHDESDDESEEGTPIYSGLQEISSSYLMLNDILSDLFNPLSSSVQDHRLNLVPRLDGPDLTQSIFLHLVQRPDIYFDSLPRPIRPFSPFGQIQSLDQLTLTVSLKQEPDPPVKMQCIPDHASDWNGLNSLQSTITRTDYVPNIFLTHKISLLSISVQEKQLHQKDERQRQGRRGPPKCNFHPTRGRPLFNNPHDPLSFLSPKLRVPDRAATPREKTNTPSTRIKLYPHQHFPEFSLTSQPTSDPRSPKTEKKFEQKTLTPTLADILLVKPIKLHISRSVTFDYDSLIGTEAGSQVSGYLNYAGMNSLFAEGYPIYTELCKEFFSSFKMTPACLQTSPDLKAIRFRLYGQRFHMSINEFSKALGGIWDRHEKLDRGFRKNWTMDEAYKKLCGEGPAPLQPTSDELRDPLLRYTHRLLATNLSGRSVGDAHLMTRTEMMGFGSSITELTRKLVDFPGWGFLDCSFPEEEFSTPIMPSVLSFPLPDPNKIPDPDEVVDKVDPDPPSPGD